MTSNAQQKTVRVLRIAAKALAVALGMLLFVGAAVWGFALTRPGGRLLSKIVTAAVNGQIRGRISVGGLAFRGSSIELRDVALDDPEDHRVLSLSRLFLGYQFGPLLHHQVRVTSLLIKQPVLRVQRDELGLNLARALAPRHPKAHEAAKPPDASAQPWRIDVEHFVLDDGLLSTTVLRPPAKPLRVYVSRLNVVSSARLDTFGQDVNLDLVADAEVDGPDDEARTLAARVKVARQAPGPHAPLALLAGSGAGTGDLRLGNVVSLHFDLTGANDGTLQIESIHLAPGLMAALLPTWPLVVGVDTTGSIRLTDGVAAAALRIEGEGTSGALTFAGDVAANGSLTPHGLTLQAHELRLSQWLRGLPPMPPLALRVRVEAGSLAPEALNGGVRLDMPKVVLHHQSYGPFHAEMDAAHGDLERFLLSLPLPGMLVSGQGGTRAGTQDHTAEVTLRVAVRQLSTARRAWLSWSHTPLPVLAGRASLLVTASASRRRSPRDATWRDATLNVRAALQSPTLTVGETTLRGLFLEALGPTVNRSHQEMSLKAGLRRPFDVGLSMAVTADQEAAATPTTLVSLRALEITYEGAHWKNVGTAQLQKDDRLRLRNFRLQSDKQALALEAERTGELWDGRLRLEDWDLGRLPLPLRLRSAVGGLVDVDAQVSGAPANPRIDAHLRLTKGRFQDERRLAAGDLEARFHFEGPMDAPGATLSLDGQHLVLRPRNLTESNLEAAGIRQLSYSRLNARLRYAAPAAAAAVTVVDAGGGTLRLNASTRLTIAELTHLTPAVKAHLERRGLQGSLTLAHWDPAGLALFLPALRKVDGRLTAAFRIAGTVQTPMLAGDLSWKNGELVTAQAHQGAEPPQDRGATR